MVVFSLSSVLPVGEKSYFVAPYHTYHSILGHLTFSFYTLMFTGYSLNVSDESNNTI